MTDDAQSQTAADAPIDAEALGWSAAEPPSGFAERTVDAFFAEASREATAAEHERETEPGTATGPGTHASRRSRGPLLATLTALAAALVLWLAWPGGGTTSRDELHADAIESVALGSRAIAVARPGAVMRWQVDDDGTTRVEQDAGHVFYRVDAGGAFAVQTPAGTVTVTGTCFDVEMMEMNGRAMKHGAVGAALAAAVVVTVYEGRVVLANERGEIEMTPGQRAIADGRSAPHPFDGDPPGESVDVAAAKMVAADDAVAQVARQARALEAARGRELAQEKELERLRQQVAELGGEPAPVDGPEAARRHAKKCAGLGRSEHDDPSCSFLEPDEDTLVEMAKCATVKIDYPGFMTGVDPPEVGDYAQRLGLSDPADIERLQTAADAHYEQFHRQLRSVFVELGGDAAVAEEASAGTLMSFINDQIGNDARSEVQRVIAEERAGMREPPPPGAELPLEQRAFRLVADLGNDFERHVAEQFGPERARELRRIDDGWPGSTSMHSGDCRE